MKCFSWFGSLKGFSLSNYWKYFCLPEISIFDLIIKMNLISIFCFISVLVYSLQFIIFHCIG